MKTDISQLIDLKKIDTLLEGFNKSTGFVTAILDLEGKILSKSGWRPMCTEFHRINPETSKRCTISDTVLANKLEKGEKYHAYKCLNGLMDVAVPLKINGEHVANLFSGQFFFEQPDLAFFKKQAAAFGFDEKRYLDLLNKVPVVSEEKVKTAMDFLLNMTEFISELALQKVKQEKITQNLKDSEQKFKAIFEAANAGKSIILPSGEINVNEAYCKILGYNRQELENKKWHDLTPEEDIPTIQKLLDSLAVGEKDSVRFEKRYISKNGSHIWADESVSLQRNENGEPLHFIATVIDITERKQTERLIQEKNEEIAAQNEEMIAQNEELNQANKELIEAKNKVEVSEEKLKSIFRVAPAGIGVLYNRTFGDVNPRVCEMTGYHMEELLGKSARILYPTQEEYDFVGREKYTQITKHGTGSVETRWQRKDGQIINILLNSTPVDSGDLSKGVIFTALDITERKQSELILQEKSEEIAAQNEELNQANVELIEAKEKAERNEIEIIKAQEIAHVGSWYLNVETNEVVWTEELYKMYGFDPAMPPLPYTEHMKLFTPESWEILSTSLAKTRETGIPYELELKTIRKDNSNGWMWVRGEAVLDEGNKIIGLWGAAQDITERKQSEQELIKAKEKAEESQLHFETLFAKSPVSIMIHDIDTGEIINANNTAFTSYGFDSLEALQQNDFWMEPPYSLEDAKEQIQKAAREDIQAFEWKSRKMTGEVFWELVTLRPLVIDGAERILSTAVDITDQKRKELKEEVLFQIANASFVSEDLEALVTSIKIVLNKLIDTTNFYIAFYDKVNDLFSIPYEADEKDKIETWRANKSVTGLVIKKGMPLLLKKPAILNLIKSGEIDQVGTLSEVWLGVPLFSGSDIIGVLAVQDYHNPDAYNDGSKEILKFVSSQISMGIQRKKFVQDLLSAKDKAEESERKFRLIGENTSDGIIVFDSNFQIIYVSPAYENQLGYSAKEEIFRTTEDIVDLIYPDDRDTVSEIFKAIEEKKQGLIYSYRVKHKQGHYIWREDNAKFNYDANNNYTGAYVVCRDITEKKIQEQQITAAKDKAEESDRLKSAFLANMSHEIRTPMNGILGFAELLKEPDLTGDEQQKFIGIIEKSGARMLNIINQIVDISKIEAGLMELDVKETNINMQIEYIYTFFKPEAETKGIKLSFSSTLSQKEATINTDREKVYAILTNLVKNAIKYTHEGSIEFGYKIAGTQSIASLQFYVKDTGIGIPKDRQEAIFERFVQADIEDRMAYQGAGLGLSISKAYVELLGGKIWVESEAGKGSTFYFTLPYNTKPVAETIARQHILSEKNDDVRKLKILIAEDDVVSEMLISRHIEMFGKEILKARTGFEAVEACRANPDIDLILMDIRMPNIGGYEATRQIREFNKKVVIIAQTAYGLTGDREKAINAGCDDYITKPLKKSELLALIQKYFG